MRPREKTQERQWVAPSIVASTIVGAFPRGCVSNAPTSEFFIKKSLEGATCKAHPQDFRTREMGRGNAGCRLNRHLYFSSAGKGLETFSCLKRPQLRAEFRGATDKVEAVLNVRAEYVHELLEFHEWIKMKKPQRSQRAQRLFKKKAVIIFSSVTFVPSVANVLIIVLFRAIRAIRGQIPDKTRHDLAKHGRIWQKMAERYSLGQVQNIQYSAGKGVAKNEGEKYPNTQGPLKSQFLMSNYKHNLQIRTHSHSIFPRLFWGIGFWCFSGP